MSDDAIEEETNRYREGVAARLAAGESPAIARSWFTDFFKRRRFEIVESKTIEVRVPLFKLHSPAIRGSRVTYEESETNAKGSGWTVTIFGTGMGSDQKLEVQYSATFRSENGGYELVFAPVEMRVDRVLVYEKNELVGEGIQSEVSSSMSPHHLNKALKTLSPKELRRDSELTVPDEELFQLSESTSSIATYAWRWTAVTTFKINLGAKVFGMAASIPADVQRAKELKLEFELPCGHDYAMLKLRDEHGLVWKVDRQPPRVRGDSVTSVRSQ